MKCCIAYFSVIPSRKILFPLQFFVFYAEDSDFAFDFLALQQFASWMKKKAF